MGTFTVPNTFSNAAVISATAHNSNWSTLATLVNGNLDSTNISSSAGLSGGQIASSAISTAKIADDAVTSDKVDPTLIQYVAATEIAFASVRTLNTAPVTVVSAPAAGYVNIFHKAVVIFDYSGTAYANAHSLQFDYNGAQICSTVLTTNPLTATADTIWVFPGADPTTTLVASAATAIRIETTADLITGTSPLRVKVWYSVVPTGL